ncbi:MAG: S41 family peptidase [Campylobacterota bacterium]|nr:S41 family peptidase [Campylobacterota bacterium]
MGTFKELDTIKTNDYEKFKDDTNKILKKYLNDEVIVLLQNNSKLTKQKQDKVKSLKYDIKDEILYLTPDLLSSTIHKELKELFKKDTKYKKIVLDLKGNEGGSLNTIRDVISSFLPDKYTYIFNIKEKGKRTTMYATNRGKTLDTTTPLEILIDKKTARGAMYIASILSKQKRANVEGEYSKIDNTIQRVIPLNKGNDVILKFQEGFTVDDESNEFKIYRW